MQFTLLLTTILLYTLPVFSHGGATESTGQFKGCHHNKKSGGFHCHKKSPYAGRSWGSKEEARASIGIGEALLKETGQNSPHKTTYDRSLFGNWTDADHDCMNTRHELLQQRSLTAVTLSKDGCQVLTGQWRDFYYDEILTSASQIDIDHVVPLKHAFDTGAASWQKAKRVQFANDPDNLVITNLKYNRQKGSQTPLTWMPSNREYACKYLKKWMALKKSYELKISAKEGEYLEMLKCPN